MREKLISLGGAILVLAIFYLLNPQARDFSSFTNNIQRTMAIDNCRSNPSWQVPHPSIGSEQSHVLQVIDGDTIEVLTPECGVERVRMIGINTPESVDPRRPVECFGLEASHHAKEILSNTDVNIKGDPTQDVRDKYGRLLGYVFFPDGTLFNELMIQQGYAYEYTYNIPYQYQKQFKSDELTARQNSFGLWATSTCSGEK